MGDLSKYHDKHLGETIFILGNSEELNSLTDNQIKLLESEYTTIGVSYSHMVINSNYMITGHMSQVVYAKKYADIGNIFFQTYRPNPIFGGTENVDTILCNYGNGGTIRKGVSTVEGCSNISISASHLAYLMGASRVVYLGFNQKNLLHFYDTNEEHKSTILSNIQKIRESPSMVNTNTIYNKAQKVSIFNDYDAHINNMESEEVLRNNSWSTRPNNSNNINILTNMFNTMKNNGIEVISTVGDSIMTDSGAKYQSLDSILNVV